MVQQAERKRERERETGREVEGWSPVLSAGIADDETERTERPVVTHVPHRS